MRSRICGNCFGSGEVQTFEEVRRDAETVTVKMKYVKCINCKGTGMSPMTNADHIRSMSDEELAKVLVESQANMVEMTLEHFGIDFSFSEEDIKNIVDDLVEWLKKPREDDHGEK